RRRGESAPTELLDESSGGGSLSRGALIWIILGGAVVLVLGVVGLIMAMKQSESPADSGAQVRDTGRKENPGDSQSGTAKDPTRPVNLVWPSLYQPSVPPVKETLARDFLSPWQGQTDPCINVPILRVERQPTEN